MVNECKGLVTTVEDVEWTKPGGYMFPRLLLLLSLLLLPQTSLAQQSGTAGPNDVPDTCPVTKPLDRPLVPPMPYPAKAYPGSFYFGTDELWTVLPENGTWKGASPHSPSYPTTRQKFVWFRHPYDWRREPQDLTVTGRRLDAPAPPLTADQSKNASCCWAHHEGAYINTVLSIPALGCWQITLHNEPDELTFVVWVAK